MFIYRIIKTFYKDFLFCVKKAMKISLYASSSRCRKVEFVFFLGKKEEKKWICHRREEKQKLKKTGVSYRTCTPLDSSSRSRTFLRSPRNQNLLNKFRKAPAVGRSGIPRRTEFFKLLSSLNLRTF